jgi:hypothetical protein
MEELLSVDAMKEFLKSYRVGLKAFIIQRHVNRFGCYLAVGKYGGGGWHGSIVVPEGQEECKGWFSWVMELHKAVVSFEISIGGRRRGGLDPHLQYGGGNRALCLGKAPLGHGWENMEERFLAS